MINSNERQYNCHQCGNVFTTKPYGYFSKTTPNGYGVFCSVVCGETMIGIKASQAEVEDYQSSRLKQGRDEFAEVEKLKNREATFETLKNDLLETRLITQENDRNVAERRWRESNARIDKELKQEREEEEETRMEYIMFKCRENIKLKFIEKVMVNWDILPPGEQPFENIMVHYKNPNSFNNAAKLDIDRLKKMESLGHNFCAVGAEDFSGYVVFGYPFTDKFVLEHPFYGNAIYILSDDWKELSKLTKRELIKNGTERIIHNGDWFGRVKENLGYREMI